MFDALMNQLHRRAEGFPDEPWTVTQSNWSCAHCNNKFDGPFTKHLGRTGCWWHPGKYDPNTGRWSCCGHHVRFCTAVNIEIKCRALEIESKHGCTPADHIPAPLWELAVESRTQSGVLPRLVFPSCILNPIVQRTLRTRDSLQWNDTVWVKSWVDTHPQLVHDIRQHTRLMKEFLESQPELIRTETEKRAKANVRQKEIQITTRDAISWLPYQLPPEAEKKPSSSEKVAALKYAYLAQLLVAPERLLTQGMAPETCSVYERALQDALKDCNVQLCSYAVVQRFEQTHDILRYKTLCADLILT